MVFSILVIVAIGAAAAVPLVSGEGLPDVRLLDEFFPESGTAAGTVEVEAVMRPDGDVAVTQTVGFPDETGNVVTIERPCGQPPYVFACVTDVTVGGAPAPFTERAARTQIEVDSAAATIGYTLRGAVLAHTDIAVLDWTVVPSAFGATPFEDRVSVTGTLRLPGRPRASNVDPHLHATAPERTVAVRGAEISFATEAAPLLDVQLDVGFPPGLVPGIPDIRRTNAEGRASFAAAQAVKDQADQIASQTLDDTTGDLGEIRETAERVVAGLALVVPGFLWLVVLVTLIGRLRRLAQPLPDTPRFEEEPPSEHDPALVNVLVTGGEPGTEAVAGTILSLAARGDVEIQDLAGDAFLVKVKDTAMGTTGIEALLLATLRTLAVEERGAINAPPLWKRRFGVWNSLRKDALRRAEVAGLLEDVVSTRVAVAAIVMTALGAAALYSPINVIAFTSLSIPLVIAAIVATFRFGKELTYTGRILQARWQAYARHLRERTSIAEAPPGGVVIWGHQLVYGTVIGAAPEAARLLSPPA